ncbi:MAG: arginine deiminase [Bacilli bacterium]
MNFLNVTSEIGRLKKVMVHRPGKELENLTPKWLEHLLFDDIPWLDKAKEEHDNFVETLRKSGVEVLYLTDLMCETLDFDQKVKNDFIKQFIDESNIYSESLKELVYEYLSKIDSTKELIETTMAGIRKTDLENYEKRTLSDYIRDYPFICDPMPNLYFTRDPFSIIGSGVAISSMKSNVRSRETIYGDYIFRYHPDYKNPKIQHFYHRLKKASIEGGDILVLNKHIVAIGVSQRTHPFAIEDIAKELLISNDHQFEKVLAFDIPKTRAFMHLDTVFTQVDTNIFLSHSDIQEELTVYELTLDLKKSKVLVKEIHKQLKDILEYYLKREIILIPCGGNDVISGAREQWNDGANTLAISPGEVIVYERNHITNDILRKHGVKVHTIESSELSRGRGGPRCMSMPFVRENE